MLSDAETENIDGNEEGSGSISSKSDSGDVSEELNKDEKGKIIIDNFNLSKIFK